LTLQKTEILAAFGERLSALLRHFILVLMKLKIKWHDSADSALLVQYAPLLDPIKQYNF